MNNPYSIIDNSVMMGTNVKIGRFCIIESNVEIGNDVVIGDYSIVHNSSKIGNGTRMGTHNKIGANVTIGENCSFTSYCEIRDNCLLGNRIKMGSRCTLSAGIIVEDDVTIKYSFVFTDTPNLKKDNNKIIGTIQKGARVGANVTILPGVIIGQNTEIGACSQIRHNVPDNEVWYGNPAKFFKKVE